MYYLFLFLFLLTENVFIFSCIYLHVPRAPGNLNKLLLSLCTLGELIYSNNIQMILKFCKDWPLTQMDAAGDDWPCNETVNYADWHIHEPWPAQILKRCSVRKTTLTKQDTEQWPLRVLGHFTVKITKRMASESYGGPKAQSILRTVEHVQ